MSTQFDLTDDQCAIQEMAQRFTADAITPFAAGVGRESMSIRARW